MSNDVNRGIIGINWGSSNFRAFQIGADGAVIDSVEQARGIAGLDRAQMSALVAEVAARWPDTERIYASGMIGSNIGWSDAGYVDCPATLESLAGRLHVVDIGAVPVSIVPGLACRRGPEGVPDIMRGEETELLGLIASRTVPDSGVVALPGTHSKWVRLEAGAVVEFLTAMSGEIYDRLTGAGLLASIVDGPATAGPAFDEGLHSGYTSGTGLGTLLFGARARVIRGDLAKRDGASYLRGLLIGAELADVGKQWTSALKMAIPLVGAAPVCVLYAHALQVLGGQGIQIQSRDASTRGFSALHAAAGAVA